MSQRFDKLVESGCICCRKIGYKSPAEVHHIVRGMRRIGDDETIPLCAYHHRGVMVPWCRTTGQRAIEDVFGPARHVAGRRAFEKRFGSEKDLLLEANELIDDTTVYCDRYDCYERVADEGEHCPECHACLIEHANEGY